MGITSEFCIEFNTPEKSTFYSIFSKYGITSRVIYETSSNAAIAGLGALTEGYLLLLPKKHYLSLAELPTDGLIQFEKFKNRVTKLVKSVYNTDLICFEHGPISPTIRAGCCIDHAHLHVAPCPVDLSPNIRERFEEHQLSSLADLKIFSEQKRAYLFYENQAGCKFAYIVPELIESQYLRRLWAKALGKPDEWDWGVALGEQNILNTLQKLRSVV